MKGRLYCWSLNDVVWTPHEPAAGLLATRAAVHAVVVYGVASGTIVIQKHQAEKYRPPAQVHDGSAGPCGRPC
eukprot:jgi/Botrbrau1/1434/Bobra.0063s0125.1